MDEVLSRLVDKAWATYLDTPENTRCLIALGGIPGSGKTTLSARLTASLNARHAATSPPGTPGVAVFLPMDGFHYARAQLDAMPDPATAHARRGAEFTFDGTAFLRLVQRLNEPLTDTTPTVFAPSFDHALKDPKEDDIAVERTHRIVVLEGNYLLLDKHPWSLASCHFSLKIFVSVAPQLARARLVARHLAAGLCSTPAEADQRAVENDLPNGKEIVRLLIKDVDDVVESCEDDGWAG
ncbi:P-loop containing nucleoside triphosphate hydrolase protein [Parathielavia appendiculata]|uniref:P-loop containing nucleoside triphosphate hydrolase protein n=1 Tax=Parathielavia appendiculata TaxID=2587402 RepID=A0AAN6Z1A6_9PEZI|nr:P-loop containing nucleoside triphosphate hydrolase protein [Parathielavia appendiculata]